MADNQQYNSDECLLAMREAANAIDEFITVFDTLISYGCNPTRLIAAKKTLIELLSDTQDKD